MGLGYSSLCTARPALATTLDLADTTHTISTHPLVSPFVKGVYQCRPSRPRYTPTWDVSVVLDYLKQQWLANEISLKDLSAKLAMLCLLVSGSRGQTIHMLDITDMVQENLTITFHVSSLIETSKPGHPKPKVHLVPYPDDERLCVVTHLLKYLRRTKQLRGDSNTRLFISYNSPFKPISRGTLSRWVKNTMQKAGLDTKIFKPHSTRAASSSAAAAKAIPIDSILGAAGWASANTFAKYYNRPIEQAETIHMKEYGHSVLSS